MDRICCKLDTEKRGASEAAMQNYRTYLVVSLDKDGRTARCADKLAVASVKVLLIVLDFDEYPCISFKSFSLFRLPDDRVSAKRTIEFCK